MTGLLYGPRNARSLRVVDQSNLREMIWRYGPAHENLLIESLINEWSQYEQVDYLLAAKNYASFLLKARLERNYTEYLDLWQKRNERNSLLKGLFDNTCFIDAESQKLLMSLQEIDQIFPLVSKNPRLGPAAETHLEKRVTQLIDPFIDEQINTGENLTEHLDCLLPQEETASIHNRLVVGQRAWLWNALMQKWPSSGGRALRPIARGELRLSWYFRSLAVPLLDNLFIDLDDLEKTISQQNPTVRGRLFTLGLIDSYGLIIKQSDLTYALAHDWYDAVNHLRPEHTEGWLRRRFKEDYNALFSPHFR